MIPQDCRPNPDELLRRIQEQEVDNSRGRLKVFLGYAPRVGKSLRMFEEGARRLKRGQDVVVGAVQTSGSQEIEDAIRGMEVIPPLPGTHALNIPALLKRSPGVCLVDELARENPEGCENRHRWQDVEQLRAAGIHVVGAINLQHVHEELDAVERITGRRAAHSVPAEFIHGADELVIVDVPAGELTRGSLTAAQLTELRELALLLAAQVVEEQLQRYMNSHGIRQSWGTQERILVCITPRSSARAMLGSAARATQRFHGHLHVVYVQQEDLSRSEEETLSANLALAISLGAEVHRLSGSDPIGTILEFARNERITQLFIGHTQKKKWKFWTQDPASRLIAAAEGMDVRLFPQSGPVR